MDRAKAGVKYSSDYLHPEKTKRKTQAKLREELEKKMNI